MSASGLSKNLDDDNLSALSISTLNQVYANRDIGLWTLDFGPWTLDFGLWTLDFGRSDVGLGY